MTDRVQPLHLFSDPQWQHCLEVYVQDLDERPNKTHAMGRYPFHLCEFFTDRERTPADYSRAEIEDYCHSPSCHGESSMGSRNRRRAAIRDFYDFATTFAIDGQLLYQGANPARTYRVSNQDVPTLFADEYWQSCFEHFLESLYRRSGSRATVVSYLGVLRQFFSKDKNPDAYSRQEVETFVYSRSDKPWCRSKDGTVATATTNKRISVLRSFFDHASAWTIEGPDGQPVALFNRANPCTGLAHGQPMRVHKSLSQQEIAAFFSAIPDSPIGRRDRVCFLTFLVLCRRRSEIQRLTWGDIEYGVVTDEDGSTHEGYLYHFTGKGRSGFLDVAELPIEVYAAIKALLISEGRWDTIHPGDPIFRSIGPDVGGNVCGQLRPLSSKAMGQQLKLYARASGIDTRKFSLHSLRHCGAFLRKISGSDLFSISRTLRHKSLDQTARYLEALVTNGDSGSRAVSAKLAQLGVL